MTIDTACSSSLVAMDVGIQELVRHRTEAVLVGGVGLINSPRTTREFMAANLLSPSRRCATFDLRADGYLRSEGCGVVLMRRLRDALWNNQPVHAIVRGSAVNQDGNTPTLTAPNRPSQEALYRQALEDAGLKPTDIHYIECHGTGTPLGDPIKTNGIRKVYEKK